MEMSQVKFDSQRRLINQTADLNMEVELLLSKFNEFRAITNALDPRLLQNLRALVDNVEDYLDGDPTILKESVDKVDFVQEHLETVTVCRACETFIGVRFKEVQNHVQRAQHKARIKQFAPIPLENADSQAKNKKAMKNQPVHTQNLPKKLRKMIAGYPSGWLKKAVQEANALKNLPQYAELENSILKLVKQKYPEAKAYAFGSRVSGMGSKFSDLDFFIDVDNSYNTYNESRDDKVVKLRKIRELMKKEKPEWKNVIAIEDARVPILRAFNATQFLDVDISFSNGLGCCNSNLIEYFFTLQPLCNKMCIYMKRWLKLSGLHQTISTYNLVMMVIFYLQTEKLLPSVQMLQSGITTPMEIGPWMANIQQKTLDELELTLVADTDEIVLSNMKKFFDLYVKLPLKKLIISPYLGCAINKSDIKMHSKDLERYFNYYKENPNNGLMTDKPFCVQDPFELNHNVAKGISDRILALMQHFFRLSLEILEEELVAKSKPEEK